MRFQRHSRRSAIPTTIAAILGLAALAALSARAQSLPSTWVGAPEDREASVGLLQSGDPEQGGRALEGLFEAQSRAAEDIPPADLTRWHLDFFTTDLAVSAQGLFGALTLKGTPSVQAFWAKATPPPARPTPLEFSGEPEAAAIEIAPDTSPADIEARIEPAVRATLASGKVKAKHEGILRQSLRAFARQFQMLVREIDQNSPGRWWVSGFRADLTVDAGGRIVTPSSPPILVGAEVRLRFDWKRIRRQVPVPVPTEPTAPADRDLARKLRSFVVALEEDLELFVDGSEQNSSFRATTFRVGVGLSVRGDFGIVKGGVAALGHLNFTRDPNRAPAPVRPESEREEILVIEREAPAPHLDFARARGLPFGVFSRDGHTDAVYRIERRIFRAGLRKAGRIGSFFTHHASRAKLGSWKIRVMKLGFDASIAGDLGLVSIAGLASTEATFRNQAF